jgi:hypothetical protein
MLIHKILRRAVTASPEEWRVRTAQLTFHTANRILALRGCSVLPAAGHLRSLGLEKADLPAWWRARRHRWFLDSGRRDEIRAHVSRNEEQRAQILHRADLVLSGKMPLFSHPAIDFTASDRWQRDPILGIRAPDQFYGRIPYLDSQTVGDSKFVWEPSRFGWVYWLGAASVITGHQRYEDEFCALTRDWLARNRYPMGIHYCSSLEVAIRAYAWVWALDLFAERLSREPDLLDQLLHGLWTACRHVERTLSHYFAPNTHLLGEAFGLFACGAALPEFREAPRWRRTGTRILDREARRQLHRDGTHRELSSCYHLYTTDIYLQACAIAQQCGVPLGATAVDAARRLAARLDDFCPADFVLPQFNDCDGGRLTWFGLRALDAAPALATAASLFGASEPRAQPFGAQGYSVWMCPRAHPVVPAENRRDGAADTKSVAGAGVHDSGIVTYRNSAGDFLAFRAGPFGYMSCGHSHDAPTSIILYLGGRAVIVDSGTGAYTQSKLIRDRFRSASGKNILLIDGRGPSEPGGWFDWKRKTDATLILERRFPGGFLCQGVHEGYRKALGFAVTVTRTVVIFEDGVVVLLDRWAAERPVHGRLVLTLSADLEVDPVQQLIHGPGGQAYHLSCQSLGAAAGRARREAGTVARVGAAGRAEPSPKRDPPARDGSVIGTARVPYSPDYGTFLETNALVCDFGRSQDEIWATVLSRSGPVSETLLRGRLELAGALSPGAALQVSRDTAVVETEPGSA